MKSVLSFLYLALCAVIVFVVPAVLASRETYNGVFTPFDGAQAVLVCAALALVVGIVISRHPSHGPQLLQLFLLALFLRLLVATIIFLFEGQQFFGGDANTYDFFGYAQIQGWFGDEYYRSLASRFVRHPGSGWGMVYFVACLYGLIGRNMLATQFVNSVLGAATSVVMFLCAQHVFRNLRVARITAIFVAFFPSLVLWSCQGLKDGPIVLCLTLATFATLKLGDKLSVKYISVLLFSLLALFSLRFYVFYMIGIAVAGTLIIGMQSLTAARLARQFVVVIVVGTSLLYFGISRSVQIQVERYGNLEVLQRARKDLSRRAESGFGRDVDVSNAEGAIATIPVGLVYLLLAPFPWELGSLRQSITLPEMIVWWISLPLLIVGLWFGVRYRLRMIAPVLVFTILLSLAYSMFQGNVGTAYRQRAQLLVFYFMFIAVGYVLLKEKREERKQLQVPQYEEELAGQANASLFYHPAGESEAAVSSLRNAHADAASKTNYFSQPSLRR
jgi:hypothetical protein